MEIELSVRRIPYRKYGGLRFLEAAHVKDFVTTARLLDNPHDEIGWFRLLRLHEGIGPARARSLVSVLQPESADLIPHWPDAVAVAPATTRAALSDTLDGLGKARLHTPRADAPKRSWLSCVRYSSPGTRTPPSGWETLNVWSPRQP